jgi:hypothetical protein
MPPKTISKSPTPVLATKHKDRGLTCPPMKTIQVKHRYHTFQYE